MNDTTHDSALVDEIMAEFTEGLRAENEGGKAGWMECFSPEVRMRTINGMMLQVSCLALSQTHYYILTRLTETVPTAAQRASFRVTQHRPTCSRTRPIMHAGPELLVSVVCLAVATCTN